MAVDNRAGDDGEQRCHAQDDKKYLLSAHQKQYFPGIATQMFYSTG
jgi:hypothetical protein